MTADTTETSATTEGAGNETPAVKPVETKAAAETAKRSQEAPQGKSAEAKAATAKAPKAQPLKAKRKIRRKARTAPKKPQVRSQERKTPMKNETPNTFAAFSAFPGVAAFEKLFTEAAERSEQAAKRSRKAAEELADLYRGNIDAVVESGRIAATGVQSIGQDLAVKSRDNLEQTASTVRSFVEAKSPTELLQLQGDFARTAFDRFVEESSALTETMVKLAGEAFQPLSSRASATVERFNDIAA